jgi:RNA polymerase sigma factor (sigma-70 family)
MAMSESKPQTPGAAYGRFRTTHWSAVVRAGHGDSDEAHAALSELCQAYWYPLYALARREGHAAAEAEDLTQGFFERLIERQWVARAKPDHGRFRSFLLTLFRRFLANEWHREHRQKRGGFQPAISLDLAGAESRYEAEPAHTDTPDLAYDRQWAQTLLDQVIRRLRTEYIQSGRARLMESLEACLTRDETAMRYAEIAVELGLSEAAVKMAMQRLRKRYRILLREEIARTVASPEQVEPELRSLFAAFRG